MKHALTLSAVCVLFWGLVAVPARYFLGGEWTYVYSGTAMLLCLLPGVATLLWAAHVARKDPRMLVFVALGATGVRLFGVSLAALLLVFKVPAFREERGFLLWLVVFYLFTLAVEMSLLLSAARAVPQTDR